MKTESFPSWWGTKARDEFDKALTAIPFWRRMLLALLSYGTWREAVNLGKAAVLVHRSLGWNDNVDAFDRLVYMADVRWAKIFGLDIPSIEELRKNS